MQRTKAVIQLVYYIQSNFDKLNHQAKPDKTSLQNAAAVGQLVENLSD